MAELLKETAPQLLEYQYSEVGLRLKNRAVPDWREIDQEVAMCESPHSVKICVVATLERGNLKVKWTENGPFTRDPPHLGGVLRGSLIECE